MNAPNRMKTRRGRGAYLSGLAAEEQVARAYQKRGAKILARRHRNEGGEIDLILLEGGILVFVEVKSAKTGPNWPNPSPIGNGNAWDWRQLNI